MTFKATLQKMDSNVWGLYFPIPAAVHKHFKANEVTRFVCTINEKIIIHRAFLPRGDGSFFLYVNKGLMKQLRMRIGDEATITVEADKSEYGMPLPEELSEGFFMMPDADRHFHELTPGKQRTLIYMVSKPKRPETRAKKAIQILEYLEAVNGKLDFKELNEWFKNYNAQY